MSRRRPSTGFTSHSPAAAARTAPAAQSAAFGLAALAALAVALTLVLARPARAAEAAPRDLLGVAGPVASALGAAEVATVASFGALPVDREAARAEDAGRAEAGLPLRYSLPQTVGLTPENSGTWEELDGGFSLWRLRVTAPGAMSLNLGFTAFRLPAGGRLALYPADVAGADDPRGVRVFTADDNEDHGQLWTPVVVGDDLVVELALPTASRRDYELVLGSVNRGYRFFGESLEQLRQEKSGSCNVDVVCPEGDAWRLEINSVGVYSLGGSTLCTGFMVNNTAEDGTPYFMTANHCNLTALNAASLVVYWNFQSPTCGAHGGGSLAQFQTGAVFLAASGTSDFTLVRLDDPADPTHNLSYVGWDRTTAVPTSATCIHHPDTDEKSISFENQPLTATEYLNEEPMAGATHLRVADWDVGTTEPGSSGSPLFDQNHRVVGQLHGGFAACGNDLSDWFGRFSSSWPGLATWLDPLGSGALTLETRAPWASGLQVTGAEFAPEGNFGGPFAPASASYTLRNLGAQPLDFTVADDAAWTDIAPAAGTLAAGGETTVTVTVNAAADLLVNGLYPGTLVFTNTTDGRGGAAKALRLKVGVPVLTLSFPLDVDPGWTLGAGWGFGAPLGAGGQYGFPDPTAGHTGANVLGFALDGDYENNLVESHLTTSPIDCSKMQGTILKFWRWLNVEQPLYDHAYLRVSIDGGASWLDVWANPAQVTDAAWTQQSYDLSALVDGQADVRLRWTMGTTDGDWRFSGWNLDDIEVWALPLGGLAVEDPQDEPETPGLPRPALRLGQNAPNPFNPLTRIEFELARGENATLAIYDLQGRLIRVLAQGVLAAGTHAVLWDGTDESGGRVSSGTYLYRLTTVGHVLQRRLTLLK